MGGARSKKISVDPEVLHAQTIRQLRARWRTLSLYARAEAIARLVDAGMGRRPLARRLGVSDGTVRRGVAIMRLPEAQRRAIATGGDAKRWLRRARAAALQEAQRQRMEAEEATARVSAEAAELIVRWLEMVDIHPAFIPSLLAEAQLKIFSMDYWARRAPHECHFPVAASPTANAWQVINGCEPNAADCPFELDRLATWLARWLPRLVPEGLIREAAVTRAAARLALPRDRT